jgi:TRIAD3 protein (E3 ubiquitin-protein ligase RNF216)
MDTSGCASSFPESELSRLLDTKSLELYYRLRQAKELEDAGLEGLESCPSCPYAVVIEDLGEKLFRCLNEACGQVTCRKCRRPVSPPLH